MKRLVQAFAFFATAFVAVGLADRLGMVRNPGLSGISPLAEPQIQDAGDSCSWHAGPSALLACLGVERFPGQVIDPGGALWHFGSGIERYANRWRDDLGVDLQIVIVSNLNVETRTFATKIFEHRRIGQDAPTGGILIFINSKTEQAVITTSYELEPVLTDAELSAIARYQLAPYASYSVLGMAVMDVVLMLDDVTFLRAANGQFDLSEVYRQSSSFKSAHKYLSGGGGALTALSKIPNDSDMKQRLSQAERTQYAPSTNPLESVDAFIRSQANLIGDPTLALFTPGSRVQRDRYPFAAFEQIRRTEKIVDSMPLHVVQRGDRAVATSRTPSHGFVPILLHRIDGTWRIDLVETWKNLAFGNDGNISEWNANHPYHFETAKLGPGRQIDAAALDLDGADPAVILDQLAELDGPLFRYLEGEILFRNCFIFPLAMRAYERAVEEAPNNLAFASRLAERARYVSFYDLAAKIFEKVGESGRLGRARALGQSGNSDDAIAQLDLLLERNPFDAEVLRELGFWAKQTNSKRAEQVSEEIDRIGHDPRRRHDPVSTHFEPKNPVLNLGSPAVTKNGLLHDHTRFSVDFVNRSGRPIRLESVLVTSHGTDQVGAMGDLVNALSFPGDDHRLAPGQSASLEQVWGFSADTAHQQVSYLFDYCWLGEGESKRQCQFARVDSFPK
jgi:tetratricopeptide (TPR) repeat protein